MKWDENYMINMSIRIFAGPLETNYTFLVTYFYYKKAPQVHQVKKVVNNWYKLYQLTWVLLLQEKDEVVSV